MRAFFEGDEPPTWSSLPTPCPILHDSSLALSWPEAFGVAEDSATFRLETDPNVSVDWTIERDGLLRMTESMNWRTDTGDANYTCLLAGFDYGRGDMGIPTSETFRRADFPNNPLTRDFDYDTLHRLTDVDYPNEPNEEFYYDLAGNLTKYYGRDGSDPNFFANTANQYTRVEGLGDEPNGFAYDTAGNMTGDSRGYSFTYDHDNHLTQVTKGGSGQRSFYYDALGRRVGMMDYTEMPWAVELYIYSGQNVVEVRDASLDRQRYFIHGPTYIDERVQMVDDAIDLPFVYLMKDLYTVAGMTNWWGGLVETYDYDAYGRPRMTRVAHFPWACDLNNDGAIDQDDQDIFDTHYAGDGNEPNGLAGWRSDFDSDGDVGTVDGIILAFLMNSPHTQGLYTGPMAKSRSANPYFFTGRWLDSLDLDDNDTPTDFTDDFLQLPMYHYRARTMDPVLMRFLQWDPAGYLGSMSLYEYCDGLPNRHVDPSGKVSGESLGNLVIDPIGLKRHPTKNCGDCMSVVQFSIAPPNAGENGWIIQHLTVRVAVFDCEGRRKTDTANQELSMSEAWQVRNGRVYYVGMAGPPRPGGRDLFRILDEGKCTTGWVVAHGRVKFIRNYDLRMPPWGLDPRGRHTTQPSLWGTPPGWTNTGTQTHRLSAVWNCCKEPPRMQAWAIP